MHFTVCNRRPSSVFWAPTRCAHRGGSALHGYGRCEAHRDKLEQRPLHGLGAKNNGGRLPVGAFQRPQREGNLAQGRGQ